MPSLVRISAPVSTVKLSSPPNHVNPYSPFCKRATLTVVLSDATKSPAGQATSSDYNPLTKYLLKAVKPFTVGTVPPPVLTRSCGTEDSKGTNTDTSTPTLDTFSFPVHGPFYLLSCIQNGAFGSAWAARDQRTGRLLCLKIFQSLTNPYVARSVQTELRMFRRMVKSRGGERGKQFIIELSRSIQHGAIVFFAMELMTTDLSMYLATNPERCKMHARRWMAQMALGIESLHDMGIIHRDIKSENILIDSRENVRIVDFGLSYIESSGKPLQQGFDYATDFLGTPPYMAPEILRNKDMAYHRRRRYGKAVDWWALGCIFFELESETHQVNRLILFDVEQDTHAYVAWTQRLSQPEQTYSRFEALDPIVVKLLGGLLRVQPSTRFSLSDMEKHEYFMHLNGTSEFDNAAARALDRPVRPELVPQFSCDDEPMKVIEAAKLSSMYDWTNLKWARTVDR